MGAADYLEALVRRLEGLLSQRLDLIERLDRPAPGEDTNALRSQLASLAHEQARVLAELTALLPPDEGGSAPRD